MARRPSTKRDESTPWLEYMAAGCGVLFAVGVLAVIAWHGLTGKDTPPDIALEIVEVHPASGGFAAEIKAANKGSRTASEVTIEGKIAEETATTVFDFVPGGAEREGTLVFRTDPGAGGVELRVLGYREP